MQGFKVIQKNVSAVLHITLQLLFADISNLFLIDIP